MTAVVHKTNLHSTERNEQLIEDPLRVPINFFYVICGCCRYEKPKVVVNEIRYLQK
jgi:hypothetical protein